MCDRQAAVGCPCHINRDYLMELRDWLKPVGLGAAVTLIFILTNFVSVRARIKID